MRRLHPRSAVIQVARASFQGAFLGFFVGTALAGMLGIPRVAIPLLAPLGAVITGGLALARYYRFQYEIAGDTLAVQSGVFARQSREIPLGRIQNVDTKQGVLNRLLGLSVVAFETAGGSTTEATLDAVDQSEVERLRRLVHRHGGDDADRAVPETDGDEATAQSAHEDASEPTADSVEELFHFDFSDLLTYALVSVRPAAPVLLLAGLPLGIDIIETVLRTNFELIGAEASFSPAVLTQFAPSQLVAFAVLTLLQFVAAALVLSIVLTVVEYYDFSLVRDGDDLRYQRGFLRRYSGTIPLSKVQTVSVRENVLMRQFGLATLVVETAGYSGGSQQSTQGVAIPMAPRESVYELAHDIEPFETIEFERPPTRARRRYAARFSILVGVVTAIGYAVDTLFLASGYWWVLGGLFALVPPAAHLRWRHRGFALDDDVLATQTGFWRQTTRIVPYYRIQTVFFVRSPFQRRRSLATVTADTASSNSLLGGSATAYDVDEGTATDLRDELRKRLYTDLLARRADRDSVTE